MNMQSMVHLVWLVPLALLAAYVGSPRFLGTVGSARVRRILNAGLDTRIYTVLHDLLLPAGGGTVHIDHLVISRFGVCVIDSIHRGGWISGTEVQARWQQKIFGRIYRFDNPVHANFLRVQALERLLKIPLSRFHPRVIFSGPKGFKSHMPPKVMAVGKMLGHIRSHSRELLSPEEADKVVLHLQAAILQPGLFGHNARWKWLRAGLFAGLLAATYVLYQEQLRAVFTNLQNQADVRMQPQKFHSDGTPKTDLERWEDGLICAYSVDQGRCACYDPRGHKAQITEGRCRELAERGSVLKQ
jgi:hypothetical protein